MKAALILGAILLMSLVMANDKGKSEDASKAGSKASEPVNKTKTDNDGRSAGIMVSEGPVFLLLPLMWMVVHLLHI